MQGDAKHPKAPLGNNFRPPQPLHHRPVRTNIDFNSSKQVSLFLLELENLTTTFSCGCTQKPVDNATALLSCYCDKTSLTYYATHSLFYPREHELKFQTLQN
ncbi:hypothetical protein RUM43_012275 [Polyplax serrata]|uniref:Alpha-carbonic anhydrase domain-containing protein n=1 Tax=Polyplax serrata TaxID=468196 RepID=A0AAN8P3F8_POLSC